MVHFDTSQAVTLRDIVVEQAIQDSWFAHIDEN